LLRRGRRSLEAWQGGPGHQGLRQQVQVQSYLMSGARVHQGQQSQEEVLGHQQAVESHCCDPQQVVEGPALVLGHLMEPQVHVFQSLPLLSGAGAAGAELAFGKPLSERAVEAAVGFGSCWEVCPHLGDTQGHQDQEGPQEDKDQEEDLLPDGLHLDLVGP